MNSDFKQLTRIIDLAVEDKNGKMWFPVYGYCQEVVAYAPAAEALELFEYSLGEKVE